MGRDPRMSLTRSTFSNLTEERQNLQSSACLIGFPTLKPFKWALRSLVVPVTGDGLLGFLTGLRAAKEFPKR